MNLIKRMKAEVIKDLNVYLDDSRCFNATGLAETFLGYDDIDVNSRNEEFYFDAAGEVAEWATKKFGLNT